MSAPDSGDVARMQRIIDRLRSYGVTVREMPGWQTRGFRYPVVPTRIFDHHDASSRKSGEWGSLGLILDGTPRGIPGPLSNFEVARCLDNVPKLAIVAAGYCYHAGAGGPWNELPRDDANPRTYGAEKANDGLGEPYTAAANYATNALFHACAVECGAIPESFPLGHKEWTTRKSDPAYSMPDRRRQVGAFTPNGEDDFMALYNSRSEVRDDVANAAWNNLRWPVPGSNPPREESPRVFLEQTRVAAVQAANTAARAEALAKVAAEGAGISQERVQEIIDGVAKKVADGFDLEVVPKPAA